MDDQTTGLVLRALRRRRGWRQADLSARAGVSQSTVSRAERGALDELPVRTIRALFAALGARVEVTPKWRGAELERLIDEAHASVVGAVAARLETRGWTVELEVTYAHFGERGSIDVLALQPTTRTVVVIEAKTEIVSSELVGRKLDEKARLASVIVAERHGWQPSTVGRVLVLPGTMRLRRTVEAQPNIGRMLPATSLEVRRWLRKPQGSIAGVWFLSNINPRNVRGAVAGLRRRIRIRPANG